MLVIRLFRTGKKNQPTFKIMVTDKRKPPRAGRFTEQVGFYNPLNKEKNLKAERIKYWISVGAKPSPTIFNLLVAEKIIEGKKIPVHKKSKKTKEPVPAKVAEGKEEIPKENEPEVAKKIKEAISEKAEVAAEPKLEEKQTEAKTEEEKPMEQKKEEPKTEEVSPELQKEEKVKE